MERHENRNFSRFHVRRSTPWLDFGALCALNFARYTGSQAFDDRLAINGV